MTLWGSRFEQEPDRAIRSFGDSFQFDQRLGEADIVASKAYAKALKQAGLLSAAEFESIANGLQQIATEFDGGTFVAEPDDEDIHTAVERRLGEIVGEQVAGKLHTGRSRNDQVATDLRLYLMAELLRLEATIIALQEAVLDKAEGHIDVVMPGYTHMQPAQPLLFSHWLLSFFWKFQRDRERLDGIAKQACMCPLGSGAFAGNAFNIDREALAGDLGLIGPCRNSLDAVEDRDFAVDFLSFAALLQTHLSSMSETLIVWTTNEFGFITLADSCCTGSSMMPQKKNPDPLELIRGKTGRIIGHLTGFLCTLKGLPSGYNKDLQEDKEHLFDALDTLLAELPVMTKLVHTMKINAARMARARTEALLATDLADYLTRKGVPFRESHRIVGKAVRMAEERSGGFLKIELKEYKALHPDFEADVYTVLDYHKSVDTRDTTGGTASQAVKAQLEEARALIDEEEMASFSHQYHPGGSSE